MLSDAMLDKGDLDGRAVWRHILKAVEVLLANEPASGAKVQ